ncbi:hypothetical protein F0562_035899 [Nyssa sinensis]|uniref:EF-hand domain-containing protein n=1 Tax=Nyssa sinensis TaxID=561372 RepID=A0A5J5AE66_9ASTE|nr:hypothetical protein F0562_035899 [Nyssa sinensis]
MAIQNGNHVIRWKKPHGHATEGKREMTIEEFKQWLKKFDANNDGRICKDELIEAIRVTGAWFPGWKAKRGVQFADANHDGFIDESEMEILANFARKEMNCGVGDYLKMAITTVNRSVSSDGKREMTFEEFKQWLKKFDANNDGRIDKNELIEAIRVTGAWFPGWKAKRGVRFADANHNGFIDEYEMKILADFAQKEMNVRIV